MYNVFSKFLSAERVQCNRLRLLHKFMRCDYDAAEAESGEPLFFSLYQEGLR